MKRETPLETSLAVLVAAALGSATALALAAAVAGAGLTISLLAFFSVFAFGLAADRRAEVAVQRIRASRR